MSAATPYRGSKPAAPKIPIVVGLAVALMLAASIYAGRWLRTRSNASTAQNGAQGATASSTATARVGRGEMIFLQHCAKCHGADGHGDSDAIARQKPPPRDFAARPWRFEVNLDSIRKITSDGIPATSMPAHRSALSVADLDAVAAHTLRLATTELIAATHHSPLEVALARADFYVESTPRTAPDLVLSDASGGKRSLADERGRLVILHFWGTTCEHCLASMPKLEKQAERWQQQGVTVLNICADAENAQAAQELIDRVAPTSRAWVDDTGLANAQFEVQALPTIWLIDRSGKMLGCARGMKDWQSREMENLIFFISSQSAATP